MPTTFFTDLINTGIKPADATVLETQYSNETTFLDDLEIIASWMALKQIPATAKPTGEPWLTIYDSMLASLQSGIDLDSAFSDSLAFLAPDVQISITKAVSVRMKEIISFEQKKNNKKRFKGDDYLNQLKQFGYSFRYNEIKDVIEVNGIPMNDALEATIRMQLRDAGMTKVAEAEDAYLSNAWFNKYHPIRDYLNGLTWDGLPHIEKLSSYFVDEYQMFPIWLRKWLIGSCAKVYMTVKKPVQVPMLILDGPQNVGKSQFAKWLASETMEYFYEGAINPDDKDCIIRSASKWIWEVSELGATTRKSDQEALKAFLTYETVKARRPYGRFDVEKLALSTFVGTVNNYSGLFSDPTGSRRYLISKILSIDWAYSTDCDVNQVWAEAMAAYIAGEQWQISVIEREKASEINTLYDVEDPVEDLIKKYFDIDATNHNWWTSTTDILFVLEDPTKGAVRSTTRLLTLSISTAATKFGLKKGKRRNHNNQLIWGYYGIRHTSKTLFP